MIPLWQDRLVQDGARIAADGSVAFEGETARLGETVVVPLADFGLIRAGGEDAAAFLHSLTTNDTRRLAPEAAQYSALCTPKGRMLASFLVWRDGPDFLLQLSRELTAGVLKKLSLYVLRSKVKLGDASDELALIGLSGAGAPAALARLGAEPGAPMTTTRFAQGVLIRLGETRFQLAVRAEAAAQVWQRLREDAAPAGSAGWRWLEIAAGVPRITAAIQEEFVPQMANFELIGGVSFEKGCYPGQEIVARTQYLGKLKRRMYRAHLAGSQAPAPGAHLYSPDLPDQSCGTVVESAPAPGGGYELLAVMQMSSAEGGDVRLGSADGPRLAFRPLPYPLS
jgi:hypothetical protein